MLEDLLGPWNHLVKKDPRAFALVECPEGRLWTRAELADLAAESEHLLRAGPDLGGRYVLLSEPNGPHWLGAFISLVSVGAVPALLDPTEPPEAKEAIARAIGARPRAKDLCLAKITSGTTGLPKALPFTHAQIAADGRQICATMGIGPADINLAAIPFGHSYGLGNLVVPLLLQGTAIVCNSCPFPQAIAADCREWRPTVFPAVPILLRSLSRADIRAGDLASLRLVISAGSRLSPEDAQAFADSFGTIVHGFYGSSETGGICFDRTGELTLLGKGVGSPLDGVRVIPGKAGRFTVESPAVMGRGRHSPEDLGELTADGAWTLLGRVGRTIKIGSRKLDLAEVELALKTLPGVTDAVALPDQDRSEGLVAAVVSGESSASIRTALASRLATWKLPDRILVLTEFPVTSRGKPDIQKIRALLE